VLVTVRWNLCPRLLKYFFFFKECFRFGGLQEPGPNMAPNESFIRDRGISVFMMSDVEVEDGHPRERDVA